MKTARNLGDMENYSIYTLNGKMGLAGTPNGENEQVILTQPKYDIIYPFIRELAIVMVGKYFGVINKYGHEVLPPNRFKSITSYWEKGYFELYEEWGEETYLFDLMNYSISINSQSEERNKTKRKIARIANLEYDDIVYLQGGNEIYFFESRYYEYKYIYNDRLEKIIFKGDNIKTISNLYVGEASHNRKYGAVDKNGNIVIPFKYDDLLGGNDDCDEYIPDNLIEATYNGKSGYIDIEGNIKIPFTYYLCGRFENGYAWVSNENEKCGLIDKYGNIVEPLIHDNIIRLKNGKSVYIDDGLLQKKYYIQDKPKDYVKQDRCHKSFGFNWMDKTDYVFVTTDSGKKGITHLNGDIIIPTIYNELSYCFNDSSNKMIAKKDDRYGVIDINNNVLLSFVYDDIRFLENIKKDGKQYVFYKVWKDGKCGVVDNNFHECLPTAYDNVEYNISYKCFVVKFAKDSAMVDFKNHIIVPFTSQYLSTL